MSVSRMRHFDVAVQGDDRQYMTMSELMKCYASCQAERDYEGAKNMLEYGVESANLAATLEMARFLKSTPQLNMTQQDRFNLSEKLFRKILNTLDLQLSLYAAAAAGLASLCEMRNRTVGCLGWMLAAQRYGCRIPEEDLIRCRKKLNALDINSFAGNPQDCYDLGYELWLAGEFRFAEFFLREAATSSHRELAGRSYLTLSDLYEEHKYENRIYEREAAICRRKACENGCAIYLIHQNGN